MDEIIVDQTKDPVVLAWADVLYSIKDIMKDHNLTSNQAMFILCKFYNIEFDASMADVTSLFNKGLLLKGNVVNATLLFHLKKEVQLTLDIAFCSKPKGTELTLGRADRIEKEFVIDAFLTEIERKSVADTFFKGDLTLAKYFIIFKSLFPVKHKTHNAKWNKKFGFVYEGLSLWDDSTRVAKKFIEIYKKLDIGIFLEATYRKVKESTNIEEERCFMVKPYKHLLSFATYYRQVQEDLETKVVRSEKETEEKIDKLKV